MCSPRRNVSRKTVAVLLYLAVAMLMVGQAAAYTWTHIRWFSSMNDLQIDVREVRIETSGKAVVIAFLQNPTDFQGIRFWSVTYAVFANSTSEGFYTVRPGIAAEVGVTTASYEATPVYVPAGDSLNLTVVVSPHPEIVDSLRDLVSRHPDDLRIFVGITPIFRSSFGPVEVPHCFESPRNVPTICPGLEAPPRTRFG